MDCSELRELLSAYFDDELSSVKRMAAAEHLEGCDDCSAELAGFSRLSGMAHDLDAPIPPAQLWSQLERKLDEEQGQEAGKIVELADQVPRRELPIQKLVALAATILVAVGVGWVGYSAFLGHGDHEEFTKEFGHYIEVFEHDPAAAQEFLLAKYEGHVVDAQQAVNRVGYRPAVAKGLPQGYSVESIYVMKMPCCTCVQCVCNRNDGTKIVIFEHDDEETKEWFGDRPETLAPCNGKHCSLVELNGSIAASWKRDKRHITVVGVRDLAEVNQLVAWFDERKTKTD